MKKCGKPSTHRYTWPGEDEAVCCPKHATQLLKTADALGMHLQIIPLSEQDRQYDHALICTMAV